MTQRVESDLKALPVLGIDSHAAEPIGIEIEVEDQGLETDSSTEALQMSATNLVGTAGDIETEAGDITTQEAVSLDGAFSSAFKQFTKVLTPIGIALDFMAVERVGPPVLEFTHWGQTDIVFGGPEMDPPFYGLP